MSVLFQALQKHARQKRAEQDSVVIPMMRLKRNPAAGFSWKGFVIVCITFGGILLGYMAHDLSPQGTIAQASTEQETLKKTPTQQAENTVSKKSQSPLHGRKVEDEPQGIEVTLDALTEPQAQDDEVAEITAQLEDLPTLTNKKNKAPIPQVRGASVIFKDTTPKDEPLATLVDQAHKSLNARAYAQAITICDTILTRAPEHKEALDSKIYALSNLTTHDALNQLKAMETKLLKDSTTNDEKNRIGKIQAALAEVMGKRGTPQDAKAYLWKAVASDPDNDSYRLALAVLLDRTGDQDAALQLYRQIKTPLQDTVKQRLVFLEKQESESTESEDPDDKTRDTLSQSQTGSPQASSL